MSKAGVKVFFKQEFKTLALFCLLVSNTYAQVVQTFPMGFHGLEKAQSIAPDYAQAIKQVSQLVGRVLSDKDNGTAYLFYNDEESRWEAHSAYHVVQEEVDKSLPLAMELADKTWITLDPSNIISSDDEHSIQDRVRYTIDYTQEKPDKLLFSSNNSIESGVAILEVGYPNVINKIKVSFGHALMREENTYWLSTLTSQPGSSGSPVWLLAEDGKLALVGSVVIASDVKPFMFYAYTIEDSLLYTVLSMAQFNEWLLNASDPDKKVGQTFDETRHFFSMQFLNYYDKINVFPESPQLQYQANYDAITYNLKVFLIEAKKRVELDPHAAAKAIREGLVRYYLSNDDNGSTLKISTVDFPLISEKHLSLISSDQLKPMLLTELDKSIASLDECKQHMLDIEQLIVQPQLKQSIEKIKDLDLYKHDANFSRYHVPMMTFISDYE
ncbi:MAG TPA: hypothetical protein PKC21_08525 [Oligoflexia bacterium]|nr:hypothetical protein [Oligoflexia bacterium]HMR25384.1 hypothetical protein [Oligoflexia bacterium]